MDCVGLQPYSEYVPNGKSDEGSQKGRKEEIVKPDPSPKNSPDRVFVVQFHDPTAPGSARFAGRAEHLMSGESTDFQAPEELIDFFGRVMNQLKPRSRKGYKAMNTNIQRSAARRGYRAGVSARWF
jgi:hypothetical protein